MINPAFWPVFTAAVASRVTAAWLADLASGLEGEVAAELPQAWGTPNTVSLELETMSFRDFSLRPARPPSSCARHSQRTARRSRISPTVTALSKA